MANNEMQRRVFISNAPGDLDWKAEQIEAVASAIREIGLSVSLDLWHLSDGQRRLSLAEWQEWMDTSIERATHILCLVSVRYDEVWKRSPDTPGGFGIAFQSTSLIRQLYLRRERNQRQILTLRRDSLGLDCIPRDLVFDCPAYRWTADRSRLLSHLAEAEVEFPSRLPKHVFLDGLRYPDSAGENDASAKLGASAQSPHDADDEGELIAVSAEAHMRERSEALEAFAIHDQDWPIAVDISEPEAAHRKKTPQFSPVDPSGLWPLADEWRAPVGDFPPPWASAWGDDVYGLWADLTVNGVTQRMRWIEPSGPEGFWMGSSKRERDEIKDEYIRLWANAVECEPMPVTVEHGFWLADTPCTQAFWEAVTGRNPSHFVKGHDAPERPVEKVSWNDVMEQFIVRFAQTVEWCTGERLCLPNEQEWEYAARAGTLTAYWWGKNWDATRGNVNVTGQRRRQDEQGTMPVRRYPPNPWGLYDMHGNVWEWCSDPWQPRWDTSEARQDHDARVSRGGSWVHAPGSARSAFRRRRHCSNMDRLHGFRFALRSPAGPEARYGRAG